MNGHGSELNDILLLFSPLRHLSPQITIHDNYLIQTPVGCFRPAYSEETKTTALFFAVHPDHLASAPGPDGRLEIAHKDKVNLVRMNEIFHDTGMSWNPKDERQHFDMSWAQHDVHRLISLLPRALIRETALQRTGENSYASAFIAYEIIPSADDADKFSVRITTKAAENYRLTDLHHGHDPAHPEHPSHNNAIKRLFRKAEHQLLKWRLHSSFLLRAENGETCFTAKQIPELIETDFSLRQQEASKGRDTARWKDQHLRPIMRLGDSIRKQVDEFKHASPEDRVRKIGVAAIHLVIDHGMSAVSSALIDFLGEVGTKEHVPHAPPMWHKILGNHAARFMATDSAIHKLLVRPDPEHFRDLEWLNPAKHACNFADTHDRVSTPHHGLTFQRWLHSRLLAPHDSTFEYRGKDYELLDLKHLKDVKVVPIYVSNGIVMHYVPETRMLYAHYHHPDHVVPNRALPSDAATYFAEGHVIRIDAQHPNTPMVRIPFHRLEEDLCKATGSVRVNLPSSDPVEFESTRQNRAITQANALSPEVA